MLFNWKISFNVINIRTYDEFLGNMRKLTKLKCKRPALTSQFDVNKLQKQFQSVTQIDLDHFANFGLLFLNVCVTVSHNVAFNDINR